MAQTGFDFTGMRAELGERYEKFVLAWKEFQGDLAARGHRIIPAGRKMRGMIEGFGEEFVKQAATLSRAPGWRRCQALALAYDWLGDIELTDDQAAVLDSIIYTRMSRALRQKALQMMRAGASAQQIDDLIDSVGSGADDGPRAPQITEAEVRDAYAAMLEAEGFLVRKEQPTEDGGAVDIVAVLGDKTIIVECKVDLDRRSVIDALGQLTVYRHTFRGAEQRVAYWNLQDQAQPIVDVCRIDIIFDKVVRIATEASA